jgi:hypothetical protein
MFGPSLGKSFQAVPGFEIQKKNPRQRSGGKVTQGGRKEETANGWNSSVRFHERTVVPRSNHAGVCRDTDQKKNQRLMLAASPMARQTAHTAYTVTSMPLSVMFIG